MTILIAFHSSHYRDFKAYYCQQILADVRKESPGLVVTTAASILRFFLDLAGHVFTQAGAMYC
jgi:hypothetical protein